MNSINTASLNISSHAPLQTWKERLHKKIHKLEHKIEVGYQSRIQAAKEREYTLHNLKAALKLSLIASLTSIAAGAAFALLPPLGIALIPLAAWFTAASLIRALAVATRYHDHPIAKILRIVNATILDIHASVLTTAARFKIHHINPILPAWIHPPQNNRPGRPILLLNGYLGHGTDFSYLKQRLQEAKLGPIYTTNLGSFNSIESYARDVQKEVRKIQKETGRKDLQLVCHSKGGLVGAYYATHFAKEDGAIITSLVTLGTPFSGTPVANFGIGEDATQMLPSHRFHKDLRRSIAEHPEIPLFCIGSEADIVVPGSSAISGTHHASRRTLFEDLGHISLLHSEKAADRVCSHLKAGRVHS